MHRTRLKVFQRDDYALSLSRDKINDEFKNKKHVTDENSIRELIKHADDVETILRTQVVQLEKSDSGNYSNLFLVVLFKFIGKINYAFVLLIEMNLTEDSLRIDNVPYNDDAVIDKPRPPNQRCKK